MRCGYLAIVLATGLFSVVMSARTFALDTVVWTGGNGRWEESHWTKNGIPNQSAFSAMGDNTGGRGGMDISIGGGATVEFDVNNTNTLLGDYATDHFTGDIPPKPRGNNSVDAADYVVWRSGGTLLNEVAAPIGVTDSADYVAWRARFGSTALGDFAPRQDLVPGGKITITGGATLYSDSHSDDDGRWGRINQSMTFDNGTWLRTYSLPSYNAGRTMFGFSKNQPPVPINVNLINGGRIELHGKMVFGEPDYFIGQGGGNDGHSDGISVLMTINNGTIEMPLLPELSPSDPLYTPGGRYYLDYPNGLLAGDLIFAYEYHQAGYNSDGQPDPSEPGHPRNETYSVNFTGPGSITLNPHDVDPDPDFAQIVGGIYVIQQQSSGQYVKLTSTGPSGDLYTPIGYQDLWDLGILKANGQSGPQLGSAAFSTYFSVTGSQFAGPYVLTSKIAGSGVGQSSAVPEPGSLMLVLAGLVGLGLGRRSRS